jgi:hypothetical protein
MIPTVTRYSPMKPSTSAQPALPLSTKPTPSTAVHQRSGLGSQKLKKLNAYFLTLIQGSKIEKDYRSEDLSFSGIISADPQVYINKLEEIKIRIESYIRFLHNLNGNEAFHNYGSVYKQESVIRELNSHDPLIPNEMVSDFATERGQWAAYSSKDFIKYFLELWQPFLTQVKNEISKFQTPAS